MSTLARRRLGFSILAPLMVLAACASQPAPAPVAVAPPPPPPPPSLYDKLGGKDAITAVVDDFVGNVAKDRRISRYFRHSDIPHLKMELVDQICQASGGPCTYTGKSMKEAHMGMHVTNAAFNALVQDLQKSLNKFKVAAPDQQSLLDVLGPMRADIVEKK